MRDRLGLSARCGGRRPGDSAHASQTVTAMQQSTRRIPGLRHLPRAAQRRCLYLTLTTSGFPSTPASSNTPLAVAAAPI